MKKKKSYTGIFLLLLVCVQFLGGCAIRQNSDKVEDLEFTVTRMQELPKTLQEQIEQKKEEAFTLTYSDNEYLYIARGYGIQETGGYSISVDACYRTENTIDVKTTLHGPQAGEKVEKAPSCPFVVIKMELRSEPVKVSVCPERNNYSKVLITYCQKFNTLLY